MPCQVSLKRIFIDRRSRIEFGISITTFFHFLGMCAKAAGHQSSFIESDFPCIYMTACTETTYWGSVTGIHHDHPISKGHLSLREFIARWMCGRDIYVIIVYGASKVCTKVLARILSNPYHITMGYYYSHFLPGDIHVQRR